MLVAGAGLQLDGLFSKTAQNMHQVFDVIMCNYRGSGRSGNQTGNYGWYRRAGLILDADAAVQYARTR